jgi:hypothetical protein
MVAHVRRTFGIASRKLMACTGLWPPVCTQGIHTCGLWIRLVLSSESLNFFFIYGVLVSHRLTFVLWPESVFWKEFWNVHSNFNCVMLVAELLIPDCHLSLFQGKLMTRCRGMFCSELMGLATEMLAKNGGPADLPCSQWEILMLFWFGLLGSIGVLPLEL